ncbi:MAG: hypothetical protein J4G06_06955 [Caldilineaceae bacterium]|nr:hypothetical protein [Caldilineaceae bacterium]
MALATLIGIFYLGFAVVGVFYGLANTLARAGSELSALTDQSADELVLQSLAGTFSNAVHGLIAAWPAFVVFAVLGIVAAAGWFLSGSLSETRRWFVSFGVMASVIGATATVWMMLQRNQIQIWIAEAPELFRWREVLMRSIGTDISVILVFSLLVAAPIWMAWRWWFERLAQRRSRLPASNMPLPSALPKQDQPGRNSGTPFGRQPQSKDGSAADPYRSLLLSRPFLITTSLLFMVLAVVVLLLNSQYKESTLRLEHGAFVLTRVDPISTDTLHLDPDARKIRIVNVNGEGSVTVRLTSSESDTAALEPVTDWSFTRRNDQEYFYREFPLTGLAPGNYRLEFEQTKGWGWYEWTLSQGTTQDSTILSLAMGIVLASALVAAGLLAISGMLAVHRRL